MPTRQPDLFADATPFRQGDRDGDRDADGDRGWDIGRGWQDTAFARAYVSDIRSALRTEYEMVRDATTLPYADLTRSLLARLRFTSMVRWFPRAEGERLLTAFIREMDRLDPL